MPEITVTCQPVSRAELLQCLDIVHRVAEGLPWAAGDGSVLAARCGATFDALVELLGWFVTGCEGEAHSDLWDTEEGERRGDRCSCCDEPWPCPTERARDLLAAIRGEGSTPEGSANER